ncbi:MAG TPA: FAD:protein FMN transferase [Bacteroidales bacterium]|nr:FAD:protein FMN transferase [Bacteroidales bacterium]
MRVAIILLTCLILFSCGNSKKKVYRYYEGPIQGTYFHITYEWHEDLSQQIDSLLQKFNKSLSNYDTTSVISQINYNKSNVADELFIKMFQTSLEVYQKSDGAFDITVAPIVNLWGFGWLKNNENFIPDSIIIKDYLKYVGMDKVQLEDGKIIKSFPESMLVSNAIAQGLSVDYVSDYLFSLGLKNFLVEIGGELYCLGVNSQGNSWRIGIDKPIENSDYNSRENQIIINVSGKAIATSGNYRKYVENNNQKFGHSVDPRTGYPAENSLLSASVISESCMYCDAWATAFMVCGLEKSVEIAENDPNIEAYFIYEDKNGKTQSRMTSGFKKYVCDSY